MTVQDTAPEVTFVGTGIQTSFVFTFRVDDIAWLSVDFVTDFDQFLINADQDASPGGSVEYLVAPPNLQELTVLRTTPKTQELDYTRYDPFDSESHEDALDKLTMLVQDLCSGFEGHVLDLDIHFPDAPADGIYYSRRNNAWEEPPFALPSDHFALINIGVNTHTQIDAHIANATIHFAANHTILSNIGVNTHAQIDTHIADLNIHFGDAPADAQDYVRNNNAWVLAPVVGAILPPATVANAGLFVDSVAGAWEERPNIIFQEAVSFGTPARTGNLLTIQTPAGVAAGIFLAVPGIEDLLIYADDVDFTTKIQTQALQFSAPSGTQALHVWRFGYVSNNDNLSISHSTDGHEIASGLFAGHIDLFAQNGSSSVRLQLGTTLKIQESAADLASSPGYGQFWVDSADGLPYYTTDADVIHALTGGGVTDHFLLTNIGVNTHVQIDTHIADSTIHFLEASIDHTAISNIGVNSHANIDTHIADGTIHFTEASIDHGSIAGLADDDHAQYLLLAGRAGGQVAFGGTLATQTLELRGSTNADLGLVDVAGPMVFTGDWLGSTSPQIAMIEHQTVVPSSGAAVSGFILNSPVVTIDNGLFIWYTVADTGRYLQSVAAGFAVQTLFLAQPQYVGFNPGIAPPQAFVFAAQAQMRTEGCGVVTTANHIGLSFSPSIATTIAGDNLTVTNHIAVQCAPSWSTVAGTTANFGTVTGLRCVQPVRGLFAPTGGVETMVEYRGIDFLNMTLGGAIPRSVIYNQLVAGTTNRLIENVGGAESDFGLGDIHLDDNTFVKYGAAVATADVAVGWATAQAAMTWSTFFGLGANPLYLRPAATDTWTFQQNNGGTLDIGLGFNVNAIGFGVIDPVPNSNNWFVIFAGPNQRQVQINGEYSDVLWTASGSIDVNGATVSDLQAFKINSPAVILNGGTIDDISNLFVQAMPSFGATRTQALRVLGRARIDGHQNYGARSPAQILANSNDYQLGQNNNQRTMNLLDSDAAYNITGVDSSFGFAQDGDAICLYNVGAFNLTLTHQDAASLAANRFISSTGANYIIGPNECIWIYYDLVVARWRLLEGTGA